MSVSKKPPSPPIVWSRLDLHMAFGEGFHTAFRKALDTPASSVIWRAINDMPRRDWGEILSFVMECFPDEAFTVEKRKRRR